MSFVIVAEPSALACRSFFGASAFDAQTQHWRRQAQNRIVEGAVPWVEYDRRVPVGHTR